MFWQNPILSQININSIRNKFETLVSEVPSKAYVTMISETNIDELFPLSPFLIDDFSVLYHLMQIIILRVFQK